MSSRNAYLNREQREQALVLHRALVEVEERFNQGERNAPSLIENRRQRSPTGANRRADYLELVKSRYAGTRGHGYAGCAGCDRRLSRHNSP